MYICNVLINNTRTMAQLKDLLMDEVLENLITMAKENPSDRPIIEECVPSLSSHERNYCKKVCILLNKIRRNNISFEWDGFSFVVERMMPSGYPMMGYLYVDWVSLEYCFDNDAENIIADGRVSTAVNYYLKWSRPFKSVEK